MSIQHPSLKAMAEAKANGVQKVTIFAIDPYEVVIDEGWNGRDENPDLIEYRQRLKLAMKAGAFVPPIDIQVVDGKPIVRDGHSRTLMARELKAEGHEFVLQARHIRGNDAEMRYHMLGSAAGRPLTPLEQGRQYLVLMNMGQSVAQIATRLGQHRSTIENGLKLAEMPAAVQSMVAKGEVASHTALKTVKAEGSNAAKVLTAAVKTAKANGKKKATPKAIGRSDRLTRKGPSVDVPIEQVSALVGFITLTNGAMLDVAAADAMYALVGQIAAASVSDRLAMCELIEQARNILGVK